MSVTFDYQRGFVNYPEGTSGEAGEKSPYIDHGTEAPDKTRYFSKAEADLEWSRLWMKSWAFAGLAQDVPEIGDHFRYDLGKESFIVTRVAEGDSGIKAFYNVCPHRGNRIVHADFGHTANQTFQCDFHGWKFNLDGSNKEIRDEIIFRKEVIADRPCLTEVSCGVWNSLIFVNPDPSPQKSLIEHLDVIPGHLAAYDFSKLRVFRDLEFTWDANWKTALEAFIEFYHADDVHPEVIPVSETLECQYDLYKHGISRMIIGVGYVTSRFEDRDTVNDGLKNLVATYGGNPGDYEHLKGFEYKKALIDAKRKWGKKHGYAFFDRLTDDQIADDWNYFVFPNITINVFADSLLIQCFRPHPTDPSKSKYSAITLCLPVSDDETPVFDLNAFDFGPKGWRGEERPARIVPKELAEFGYVLAQDVRRIPEVQKGIESAGFKGARLSESEIRIRHYLAEVDAYIGRSR
jgi:phenylpropionate dioxygenase-like ring-hydroxylating dioxygenase large terminal subunit